MARTTMVPEMSIIGVNGPPSSTLSNREESTIAPEVANVFRMASAYLIESATKSPPAAPKMDKKKATIDHPSRIFVSLSSVIIN